MNSKTLFVLPRGYLGSVFLCAVYHKLFTSRTATAQIEQFIGGFGVSHGYEWYRGFLQSVLMHHVGLFGTLVDIGELYVGFAMLLGITTRFAAGVAIFMLLNFVAAKGTHPWIMSGDLADVVLFLIVMIGAAGRTLGVDRFLHERYPRIPIW
jgi:thiosulfate dehydrogenase [quinone] large subunit